MSVRPRVAVIIPSYNKASTIERALRSVGKQTRHADRVIVVNNNSTDDFDRVAPHLMAMGAEVVNCIEQGVAHARNYGIALAADCHFICCLDADDEIQPEFIAVCLDALLADNSVAIAYTRLEAVAPDGKRTLSEWPSEYRFDEFLRGHNGVPTCCLFRRSFWDRVGGFRQRYAPGGAGAEDCDFWFRIGAAGGGGKLAGQEALFTYYLGGQVSGNPDYKEVNWRSDKPWVKDSQHPFASLATPANGLAHPVRQVDEPTVAVIIPCGPDHIQYLWDALDSVESQSFRRWECIVVYDGEPEDGDEWPRLRNAFPSVAFTRTAKARSGAGAARNYGAELARAPLLLYLDADDWLAPNCLATLLSAYSKNPGSIIYSDYLGYAYIADAKEVAQLDRAKRLISHDPQTLQTVMRYNAANYRCEDAQAQPVEGSDPYIWNVVSSLVPKQYHLDIGGFDAEMESWEDWDYWIRMARRGHCFVRVTEPLLNYRFYSGTRRQSANPGESGEFGRQLSTTLLTYMAEKNRRSTAMPCRSCGGGRSSPPPPAPNAFRTLNEGRMPAMATEDMVSVELIDGNIGEHLIAFNQVSYGYRSSGDKFKMQAAHARLDRRVRVLASEDPPPFTVESRPVPLPPPDLMAVAFGSDATDPSLDASTHKTSLRSAPSIFAAPPPEPEKKETVIQPQIYNFASLWGINDDKAEILVANGVRTLNGLLLLGADRLANLLEVSDNTARNIMSRAEKMVVKRP